MVPILEPLHTVTYFCLTFRIEPNTVRAQRTNNLLLETSTQRQRAALQRRRRLLHRKDFFVAQAQPKVAGMFAQILPPPVSLSSSNLCLAPSISIAIP
jgi:hypothetical protein